VGGNSFNMFGKFRGKKTADENQSYVGPGTELVSAAAPTGTQLLTVRVIKAQDLVAKDKGGTSDPLAQLLLSGQKRETKVVPKTLNPEWEEEFTFDFKPGAGEKLDVVLYDHDKGMLTNSKEFLGAITIYIDHILPDLVFQEWHDLEYNPKYQKKQEDVTGKILLAITWSEGGDQNSSSFDSAAPLKTFGREKSVRLQTSASLPDLPEDEPLEDSRLQTAAVTKKAIVTVVKAEGLVAKDQNGFSDPLAEVHLGPQKMTTAHKSKTLNPKYALNLLYSCTHTPTSYTLAHTRPHRRTLLPPIPTLTSTPHDHAHVAVSRYCQFSKWSSCQHIQSSCIF